MGEAPISVFDRYKQAIITEEVYGEGALRFAYDTGFGRLLSRLLFARPFISHLFGWYMRRPSSRSRIEPFIASYGLDPEEFAQPVDQYGSFNDFFCRELKPEARPVDETEGSIVFPADGRHFGWQSIGQEQGVFVKGQKWNLGQLLDGREDLMDRFSGGTLVLSRLCPVDYHHFHFPVGGTVGESWWTGKDLYSVSPIALRRHLDYLTGNKRCLTLLETESCGTCCFIEVGATNVGTIRHADLPVSRVVSRGNRKGWFEFGGSSVLTLFERGRVQLSEDLIEQTQNGVELYALMGDQMGKVVS
jgi:phosphatidylserine decarboxylase